MKKYRHSRVFSSHVNRWLCATAFAAATLAATFHAVAQSWNYQSDSDGTAGTTYRSRGDLMTHGYVTLEERGGNAIFNMRVTPMDSCYQGDLSAVVTKTDETTTITVPPRLSGCSEIRFVIKNDGTGGRRETKVGEKWVWDRVKRDLTIKK